MTDFTVNCPKCQTTIPLTEALARPFIESERRKLETEVRERAKAVESREREVRESEAKITELRKQVEVQAGDIERAIQKRLSEERSALLAAEKQKVEAEFQLKLDAARREHLAQSAKIADLQKAELEYRKKAAGLAEEKRQLELSVARQLDTERETIRTKAIQEEQQRSRAALSIRDKSVAELTAKLGEAQKAELEIRKQREALEAEKQALELQVMRRLDEERKRIREATQKEEDERNRLKLAEKDKVIEDMRKQVEELRRKSEQGSQQLQGEVQELELEAVLRAHFPKDEFEPIAVGKAGGDLIQKIIGPGGTVCGTVLWESKRTKVWQDAWLAKVREDQRSTRSSLSVIVSAALPKGLTSFDCLEDVWVSSFECVIPLAKSLRFTVVQTALLQVAGQDRTGKTDRMYSYITGHDFKQRVGAIVEGFVSLRADLEREKRSVTAAWAKREKFQDLIMCGTAGMYGDLYGILGKSMPEIEGLESPQPALPLANDGATPLQVHQ